MTYVTPAITRGGCAEAAICQPDALSPVKVTVANRVPPAVHKEPVWYPCWRRFVESQPGDVAVLGRDEPDAKGDG